MIKVILEGRDAPLYHCTTIRNAVSILESDKLMPSKRYSNVTGDKLSTISFTRDITYGVAQDSIIQLVFNQRKLAQDYSIKPISEPGFSRESGWTESEERVLTNKPLPVSRYLDEIGITKGYEDNFLAKFGYLIDVPQNRWDREDKAVYQLWLWWKEGKFKFSSNMSEMLDRYGVLLDDKLV